MTNNYISQQLKNTSYRRKNNRRVSSILTQIRFQSQSQDQQHDKISKMDELDYIQQEFKINGGTSRRNSDCYYSEESQSRKEGKIGVKIKGGTKRELNDDGTKSKIGGKNKRLSQLSHFAHQNHNSNGKRASIFIQQLTNLKQNADKNSNKNISNIWSTRQSQATTDFKIKKKTKLAKISKFGQINVIKHLNQINSDSTATKSQFVNKSTFLTLQKPLLLQSFTTFQSKLSQKQPQQQQKIENPYTHYRFHSQLAKTDTRNQDFHINSNKNNQTSPFSSLKKPSLNIKLQKQQSSSQPLNLGQQNIHKLKSFIRGAYENEAAQLSSVINLKQIDKYRKQFYTFDKMYNQMVQSNIENKITIKDIKQQNFRDIVYVNELKNHATAPEFIVVMNQLKIIR